MNADIKNKYIQPLVRRGRPLTIITFFREASSSFYPTFLELVISHLIILTVQSQIVSTSISHPGLSKSNLTKCDWKKKRVKHQISKKTENIALCLLLLFKCDAGLDLLHIWKVTKKREGGGRSQHLARVLAPTWERSCDITLCDGPLWHHRGVDLFPELCFLAHMMQGVAWD